MCGRLLAYRITRRMGSGRPNMLQQATFPEISHVASRGFLDHVRREFQQADFPPFIDSLDDRAERVVGGLDLFTQAAHDVFQRIMHDLVGDIRFPELEAVFQDGKLRGILPKPAGKLLCILTEAFDEHALDMPRRDDLRALGMEPTVANAHLVHLVHQFCDQKEAKAGIAKGGDSPLRRNDDLGIIDRVLDGVLTEAAH